MKRIEFTSILFINCCQKSCLLQIILGDEADFVEHQQFVGSVGGDGAHYEDAFAFEKETVHIRNVDVILGEDVDDVGSRAGLVVDLNGEHVGELYADVGGAEYLVSLRRLGTYHTVDAKFLRVGNGGGYYLNAYLAQKVKHCGQCARLVLDEY